MPVWEDADTKAADLWAMRGQLDNDPRQIGLTNLPEDDVANADRVNEVRDGAEWQIDNFRVAAGDLRAGIDLDDWNALDAAGQRYLSVLLTASQDVLDVSNGTEYRDALLTLFPNGSQTRTNLIPLLSTQGNLWQVLVSTDVTSPELPLIQPGDWTPSNISEARVATDPNA